MNEESNKFECKFCGYKFGSQEEMKLHAMEKHPEKIGK